MDTDLFSHNALNINLVFFAVVLDQCCFDGFFQPNRINRQVLIRHYHINIVLLFWFLQYLNRICLRLLF